MDGQISRMHLFQPPAMSVRLDQGGLAVVCPDTGLHNMTRKVMQRPGN